MLRSPQNRFYIFLILSISLVACKESKPLPILGQQQKIDDVITYHTIPDFSILNQDSTLISNKVLKNNIYVADFFFTSCPSICPKVAQQMLRIQDAFQQESMFKMLSYSIDPKRDTPTRLKSYAKKLGADTGQWYFLSGDQDKVFELADAFWVAAFKDKDAPGGFDHSGKIILIDKNGHIRSFCDGTEPESVTRFLKDISKLLDEHKSSIEDIPLKG